MGETTGLRCEDCAKGSVASGGVYGSVFCLVRMLRDIYRRGRHCSTEADYFTEYFDQLRVVLDEQFPWNDPASQLAVGDILW